MVRACVDPRDDLAHREGEQQGDNHTLQGRLRPPAGGTQPAEQLFELSRHLGARGLPDQGVVP